MDDENKKPIACSVCHEGKAFDDMMPIELVDDALLEFMRKKYADWSSHGFICVTCLNRIRSEYVEAVLEAEKGEISALEEEVIRSLKEEDLLARNINQAYDEQLTLGERVADKVAEFGGSWKFIICFGGTIVLWITINSILALRRPFDPYPYILLNLVLSCLAAVQAPIIMMSQNRQAKKDRIMVDHDYRTNLKAELEVRQLNRKVDQLLMHNWQRLLDIQRVQTELMEEIARKNQDTKSAE